MNIIVLVYDFFCFHNGAPTTDAPIPDVESNGQLEGLMQCRELRPGPDLNRIILLYGTLVSRRTRILVEAQISYLG